MRKYGRRWGWVVCVWGGASGGANRAREGGDVVVEFLSVAPTPDDI
jgi:hypothetical protein